MKTTAIIYSSLDESQVVDIEYFYKPFGGLFTRGRRFYVTEITILTPLTIDPSDICTDLEAAIALDLGQESWRVSIQCDIEYKMTDEELDKMNQFLKKVSL